LQDESPASVSFRSTSATIYGHEWADADGSIKDEKAANNDKIAAAMRSGKTAVGNSQTPSIPDPDKMARELSDKILEDAGAASHGKSMNYIKRAEGDPNFYGKADFDGQLTTGRSETKPASAGLPKPPPLPPRMPDGTSNSIANGTLR